MVNSAGEVTTVVADDQATVRDAVAAMLDLTDGISVVGTAADGVAAVDLVRRLRPDVLLTDLSMPNLDGAGATEQVLAILPDTAVVLLTTYDDEESILGGLQAGARGYLTKNAGRAEIAAAVVAAAAGQSVLDPAIQRRLVAAFATARDGRQSAPPRRSPPTNLTARETEVLRLIAAGLSNREIATSLFVGESTVKTHINNLFAKAHLRDRAHAIRYAYDIGVAASGQHDS